VASRNRRNIIGSGTPEKSHSAYPCEVVGGSSPTEPWDDSSPAEALGSRAAGTWRPGQTLRVAALALAEATYAVVAPRRPLGKRGAGAQAWVHMQTNKGIYPMQLISYPITVSLRSGWSELGNQTGCCCMPRAWSRMRARFE
jgi:hypothetical protein